jgi:hypothetical protein
MVRELQSLERRLGGGGPSGPPPAAAPPTRAPAASSAAPSEPAPRVAPTTSAPVESSTTPTDVSPPSQPAPAAVTQPSAGELTVDAVRGRWNDVLEAANSVGSRLRMALAAATVEDLRADAVVLGFAADAAFQRSTVGSNESRDVLGALFERTLGRRLRVETVERAKDPSAPASDEPQRAAPATGERLTAAERAAAEQAPITRLLANEVKARLVHMERSDPDRARPGELAQPSQQD